MPSHQYNTNRVQSFPVFSSASIPALLPCLANWKVALCAGDSSISQTFQSLNTKMEMSKSHMPAPHETPTTNAQLQVHNNGLMHELPAHFGGSYSNASAKGNA